MEYLIGSYPDNPFLFTTIKSAHNPTENHSDHSFPHKHENFLGTEAIVVWQVLTQFSNQAFSREGITEKQVATKQQMVARSNISTLNLQSNQKYN